MNVVITMAGLGSRFRKAGYKVPKYMIEVKGKTLFEWSMSSLEAFKKEQFIFIVRQEDNAKDFIGAQCHQMGIENFRIIEIDHLTRGQAETAMMATNVWDKDQELFIYNIDTYIEPNQMRPELIEGEGFIPCFHAEGEHWSFVKLNENGNAIEVREKTRVSDNCSIGAYYFKTAALYETVYNTLYHGDFLEHGEQYIAPMYNEMIKMGMKVKIQDIYSIYVHVLGTPREVEQFYKTI